MYFNFIKCEVAIAFCISCDLIKKLYFNILSKVSTAYEIFFDYVHFEKKTFSYTQFRDIFSDSLKNFFNFKNFFHVFL